MWLKYFQNQNLLMKFFYKFLVVFLFISFCQILVAQKKFIPGYFIDNKKEKINCLIINEGWIYNPTTFRYKIGEKDKVQVGLLAEVKEFCIPNLFKYVRDTVDIDRSSDLLDDNEMSNSSAPEWHRELLFLKVLVEGNNSLYCYEEVNFMRFFFRVKDQNLQQLIYKKFRPGGGVNFLFNKEYINQLEEISSCKEIDKSKVENINYAEKELKKYFLFINECGGDTSIVYGKKARRWFSIKPMVGFNICSLKTGNGIDSSVSNINFNKKSSFTAGVEFEFLFPFKGDKWSFPVQVSTLTYTSSGIKTNGSEANINYNSVNISGGFRRYFFLSENWKFHLELTYTEDIKANPGSFSSGAGFSYKKFSAQIQMFLRKKVINDPYYNYSNKPAFKDVSLTFKYAVL